MFNIRVKELRENANMSQAQLAKRLGVAQSTVGMWENGKNRPQNAKLEMMATMFNVSTDFILGRTDDPNGMDISNIPGISFPAARAIPILGEICAGNGVEPRGVYDGEFFLDRSIRADFCLRVHGNSMVDEGICDGDYAFFRKDFEVQDGEIYAVVQKSENLAKIRQVYRHGKSVVLNPRNSEEKQYAPEILDVDEIFIDGEFIGLFHKKGKH